LALPGFPGSDPGKKYSRSQEFLTTPGTGIPGN